MLKWYIVQLLCPLANMLTDIEEKMGFGCNWQCNSLKPWHYSTSCLHPRVIYYLLKSKKTESTIAVTDNQRRAEHENIQCPPDFLTVWSKQASQLYACLNNRLHKLPEDTEIRVAQSKSKVSKNVLDICAIPIILFVRHASSSITDFLK